MGFLFSPSGQPTDGSPLRQAAQFLAMSAQNPRARHQQMIQADQALPGRDAPVLGTPQPHTVLHTPIDGPWKEDQAVFVAGLGCFWGAEKLFWELPGVESTAVGYAGGFTPNPTYEEVCSNATGHTEVVQVIYRPQTASFEDLVRTFFEAHDPTQGFRQGEDVGTQYRSALYVASEQEAQAAQKLAHLFADRLANAGYGAITTEIKLLSDTPRGVVYLAEDYHQQYLAKNPGGYCPVHSTGVSCA